MLPPLKYEKLWSIALRTGCVEAPRIIIIRQPFFLTLDIQIKSLEYIEHMSLKEDSQKGSDIIGQEEIRAHNLLHFSRNFTHIGKLIILTKKFSLLSVIHSIYSRKFSILTEIRETWRWILAGDTSRLGRCGREYRDPVLLWVNQH